MPDSDLKSLEALLVVLRLSTSARDLRRLGRKLKMAIGQPGAYTYHYLHSVAQGSMKPGAELARAIMVLLARSDGASPLVAAHEAQHFSMIPDTDGSLIQPMEPQLCERKDCTIKFIPNVSRRIFCYICSPIRSR